MARAVRVMVISLAVVVLLVGVAALWFYQQLRGSLPKLDGTQSLAGLSAPVTITRDALGVPTISGANRRDVARAFGFTHAQDRFFQMDLLRRRAAGELAEVFGRPALGLDRATRPHHFRSLAQQVLAALPLEHRDLLEAYAAGVNAGLASLSAKPFEYLLVRGTPAPWKPEDSLLIIYAMTLDLQDPNNTYEQSLAKVRDFLGTEAVAFFAPVATPGDAALDGTTGGLPPIPSPQQIDLRKARTAGSASMISSKVAFASPVDAEVQPGSNSFALSGAHTASGSALLANDPHLSLGVPNIWYRAVLQWPADAASGKPVHRIVGVSLPGLPFIVLGSNGHVAWGLTDAYVDTNDLVAVDVKSAAQNVYRVPGREDLLRLETRQDAVAIKGGTSEMVESTWTYWGPVVGRDFRNRPLAHHWVAYDPAATNLNFISLETVTNVTEALVVAHKSGIPAHNFLVADESGDIAWTIAGKFPRRVGFDGRLPVSWTFGDRRWDGFVPAENVPTFSTAVERSDASDPRRRPFPVPSGRLWTANNRLVGGADLALMGDGGYAPPARAAQVRDQLGTLEHATPRDLLAIALDDRGLFLEPWRELLLKTLTPSVVAQKSSRAELRKLLEKWDGRASVDSVSYRLVRTFRSTTSELVLGPIFASCTEAWPNFDWHMFNFEPAVWTLMKERPLHLLSPRFETWDELLVAAADAVVDTVERDGVSVDRATWGLRNTSRISHPLSSSLPLGLGRWLNLPAEPLPGDVHMPRIQSPAFGASMRLVVSPSHEEEGLFEMPGGQSGHPLSAFYRTDHGSWVSGAPAPLLPGATRHTLRLRP